MRWHRIPSLVVAAGLAATACSSSGADPQPTDTPSATSSPTASASPTPTPTDTASEVDLSAPPPDEVTVEYVQRVLEAIYEVEAEVIRREVAAAEEGASAPPPETIELLQAIYDGEKYQFALLDLEDDWEDGQFIEGVFARSPTPALVSANEIVEVAEDCIVATYELDRSPTLIEERDPSVLMALLRPKPEQADPQRHNPAPWVIEDQAVVTSETEGSCDN